ncbi:MAG: DUF1501 domain-containing protein [Myxococcota bacterium]
MPGTRETHRKDRRMSRRGWSRRAFLQGAVATGGALLLPRLGRAAGTDRVLVTLFLRGAADGLNLCVPAGDADYYARRPTLAIPEGQLIDLDGFFGLHPGLAALTPLYTGGRLALLHASGSPSPTRSHFDAQDFMERGVPGDKTVSTGWLNRYLAAEAGGQALAGITLGNAKDVSIVGPAPALAFPSIDRFRIRGQYPEVVSAALEQRYAALPEQAVKRGFAEALSAIDTVASVEASTTAPYPNSSLGRALRDAAALVKADIGVRIVTVNTGGWDTHSNETPRLSGLTADLAAALAAFDADLGSDRDRTALLAMTEFGRTADENDGGGTEHGHGGLMLALGGGVAGGRVHLRDDSWPGLSDDDLYDGRDLQITTDYRDVFAEALDVHLGSRDADRLFPDYTIRPDRTPGLFATSV